MRRIDELFLKHPFYGSRQMARRLRRESLLVGRRVRRLMRLMGPEAICRAPKTDTPHPEHGIYPYRLKGLTIEHPDHVRCADITCIPGQCGLPYSVAVMDRATRHALARRLPNTMDPGSASRR